jgi:hypothetical protein
MKTGSPGKKEAGNTKPFIYLDNFQFPLPPGNKKKYWAYSTDIGSPHWKLTKY